jgi:alkylation response protein AidB-like acyl-CoA dehydrogenase
MLAGEEIWCQGFSEPDAGSDLAGLRTSATATENGWKVSGQKIWTTNGAYADVCFLLARTDTNRSRHSGISAFIVDMHSPGLTVHPITQITGSREFCELFLDDVNVDQTRLIGKEGQGWPIAMTVLGFERSINFIYRQISLSHQLSELLDQVRHESNRIPRQVKDRLVHIYLRTAQLEAAVETQIDALDQGVPPGPNNSATKVFWSETYQELTDAALEIEGLLYNTSNGRWAGEYLRARASTIYSGTGEIQRNIIAERGLGLPR